MPSSARRVAVVGASLGGLTTALLLRDAGCEVDVFERSPLPLTGVGAGIVSHRVTERYLVERLGRRPEAMAEPGATIRYLDAAGITVHEQPSPYRFLGWTALHACLADAFGDDAVRGDQTVDGVELLDDGGVRLVGAGLPDEPYDLVVGADGVGSALRRVLEPGTDFEYAGYVGWRGTVPESALDSATTARLRGALTWHVGELTQILVYPIREPDGDRRLFNWIWYRNADAQHELPALLRDRDGLERPLSVPPGMLSDQARAELTEAALHLPPVIAGLVRATERPFLQAIGDLAVSRMRHGSVVLVGDAAFVARPHAAAGTAKAAANAWALHDAIRAGGGDAELGRWEAEQLELGRRLVARSRAMGERSQRTQTWTPGDPDLRFGLYRPGD